MREWFDYKPTWQGLQTTSLAIILATQREGGLWSLPASEHERALGYSSPGTAEARARREDAFGSESISLTWSALTALRHILGHVPGEILNDALRALDGLRSNSGGYGRRGNTWKAGMEVNESARHSAMALSLLLEHGAVASPTIHPTDCVKTVRWLTAKSFRKVDGPTKKLIAIKDQSLSPLGPRWRL